MDKYIKYSDIPICKIELEERCHNDRWTEIHEVAYKTEIDRIPAADVAPVRHGKWHDVYMTSPSSFAATCSICGISNDIPHPISAHYCPHCGARMDGKP